MRLRRTWGGILLLSQNSFTDWLLSVASIGHSFSLLSTPFLSFLLLSSPFFSFLLLSSFLEGGNKYVLACVIQHEAGGLSKKVYSITVDLSPMLYC